MFGAAKEKTVLGREIIFKGIEENQITRTRTVRQITQNVLCEG